MTDRNSEGGNIPKAISEKLQALKANFTDEIPEDAVHSDSKAPKNIKARIGGWFTPVVLYLAIGIEQGEITDPKIKEEITNFIEQYTSKSFHIQDYTLENFRMKKGTTKEDIERANRTIDLYLQNCKTK